MPQVPKAIVDAGSIAIVVFLIACIIYLILKITQTVGGTGNGKHVQCIQSPQLQGIVTNQMLQLKALERVEDDGSALKENMTLQTQLIKQMAHVLEKLSECAIRQEAGEKVRRGS